SQDHLLKEIDEILEKFDGGGEEGNDEGYEREQLLLYRLIKGILWCGDVTADRLQWKLFFFNRIEKPVGLLRSSILPLSISCFSYNSFTQKVRFQSFRFKRRRIVCEIGHVLVVFVLILFQEIFIRRISGCHTNAALSVSFSSDGKHLTSGSSELLFIFETLIPTLHYALVLVRLTLKLGPTKIGKQFNNPFIETTGKKWASS
ncbi:hypothetical protein FRX31_011101, partial [Thalictrum thalictroides]